jgi:hypothetical protein
MLLSVTGSSLRARPMLARASSIPTSPLVMLGDSIGVDAAALEASTTFAGDFAHVDADTRSEHNACGSEREGTGNRLFTLEIFAVSAAIFAAVFLFLIYRATTVFKTA